MNTQDQPETKQIAQFLEDLDGKVVFVGGVPRDADTGETVEYTQHEGGLTLEYAEWVVESIYDAEREAAKVREKIATLTDNLTKLAKQHENRANGLRYVYGPSLQQFAQDNLGKGRKSVQLTYGTLAFRSTKPRVEVLDKELAVEQAKKHCPSMVVVKESVQTSAATPEDKAYLTALLAGLSSDSLQEIVAIGAGKLTPEEAIQLQGAFKLHEAGQSFTVKTNAAEAKEDE